MENEQTKKEGCSCSENGNNKMGMRMMGMYGGGSGCGCHRHGHMFLIKLIVKIALLAIIFTFAFKLGELKSMCESRSYSDFRHGNMMMYGGGGYNNGPQGQMMDNSVAVPATPAAGAPTTQ